MSRPRIIQYLPQQEILEITALLQSLMDGRAKAIAANIGCGYQDLLNRVSGQPRSPRKFELILKILEHVPDPEPFIRWLYQRYGFLPFRVPKVEPDPDPDPLHLQMTRVSKETGDFAAELLQATKDQTINRHELIRLKKEGNDIIQVVLELIHALEAICNQPVSAKGTAWKKI